MAHNAPEFKVEIGLPVDLKGFTGESISHWGDASGRGIG
jgi:hypothetical protein